MSQIPAGDWAIDPNTTSGAELSNILNRLQDAVYTLNSGAARPETATAGTNWVKTVSATVWEVYFFDGTNDLLLYTIDPTTSSIVFAAIAPIITVNTRDGDVLIKEIYNASGNAIIAQAFDAGLNLIVIKDADPNANLTGAEGRLAYDTTKKVFMGFTGTVYEELGAGKYEVTTQDSILDGSPLTITTKGLQSIRVSGGLGPVTLSATPFGVVAPPNGTRISLRGLSDTEPVTVPFSDIQFGTISNGTPVLNENSATEYEYDSVAERYYQISKNL